MTPRIGLVTPVKAALGAWLTQFYTQYSPDTDATLEWSQRGGKTAMAWAPARMVDSVEEMLNSWRNNDNSGKTGTSAYLPVLFVAMASDYIEPPGETGRPVTDYIPFSFPEDVRKRSFKVRLIGADLRVQIVMVAPDVLSAMSMVAQLSHWAAERERFKAVYSFAGFNSEWPVQVVQMDRMSMATPMGEQLCIMPIEVTLRASMPKFYAPSAIEPNDGTTPDPGYPVVAEVTNTHNQALGIPTGVTDEEWAAYARLTAAYAGPEASVVLWPLKAER